MWRKSYKEVSGASFCRGKVKLSKADALAVWHCFLGTLDYPRLKDSIEVALLTGANSQCEINHLPFLQITVVKVLKNTHI